MRQVSKIFVNGTNNLNERAACVRKSSGRPRTSEAAILKFQEVFSRTLQKYIFATGRSVEAFLFGDIGSA